MGAQWLRHCQYSHTKCRRPSSFLPTRLIRIDCNGQRLILSASLKTCPPYVTLSHCWGRLDIFRLLEKNLTTLQKDIPYTKLCRTFQEAIYVARKLGFEYLWIDAMCIIQDNPEDWRQEAADMSNVYRYCTLNIAAVSALDGTQGCFADKDPNYVACHHVTLDPELKVPNTPAYTCVNSNFYEHNVMNTPLGRRAWVVQERLLASRVLNLGKDQLFWVCHEQVACEAYPDHIPTHLISHDNRPDLSENTSWTLIVSQYSNCSLTKNSDKLVAISGIARRMSENTSDRYLAGLWLRSLHTDLCWAVEKTGLKTRSTFDKYRAPTWSWACIDSGVRFRARQDILWLHLMTIAKTELKMINDDAFGEVESAFLWVKCSIFLKCILEPRLHDAVAQIIGNVAVLMEISWDGIEKLNKQCYFLPILQNERTEEMHGLILLATEKVQGQYTRIGHFRTTVEGWPYERLERLADYPECQAMSQDFVPDLRNQDGTVMEQVIMLI